MAKFIQLKGSHTLVNIDQIVSVEAEGTTRCVILVRGPERLYTTNENFKDFVERLQIASL